MEARAVARYIWISPRKVRLVADLVRGKSVEDALAILKYLPKRAAVPVAKVIKSAAANAENNYNLDRDELYIRRIFVDEGPIIKRYRPRARGRADLKRRRTSHITVIVAERKEG
ncbi:MAG: 50S ribosomal protein L22 [Syntrophomonadaceae bacterium]|nr:50S ribosomal protein L22 [Syntrophomonadaceae bacterium]